MHSTSRVRTGASSTAVWTRGQGTSPSTRFRTAMTVSFFPTVKVPFETWSTLPTNKSNSVGTVPQVLGWFFYLFTFARLIFEFYTRIPLKAIFRKL